MFLVKSRIEITSDLYNEMKGIFKHVTQNLKQNEKYNKTSTRN